jgi:hypothetical protein
VLPRACALFPLSEAHGECVEAPLHEQFDYPRSAARFLDLRLAVDLVSINFVSGIGRWPKDPVQTPTAG